jgi:hypothetical protein
MRQPLVFCASLVSSACLCRIFIGSWLALLCQAPIGVKVLRMFPGTPSVLQTDQNIVGTMLRPKEVTFLMVLSTTVGLTAWTAKRRTKGLMDPGWTA